MSIFSAPAKWLLQIAFVCSLISLPACAADTPAGATAKPAAKIEAAVKPAASSSCNSSISTDKRTQNMVKLHTNHGIITLELDATKAPITVANFLDYAKGGFYDGTIFHRVISNFMIQGGGFEPGMKQKPTKAQIQNEAGNGLKNDNYTVAMARTSDPHSATAQFFINVKNNDFLNFTSPNSQGFGYAVFGKVVDGLDVVDKIKGVKTSQKGMHGDVPVEDVIITRAEVC
ncbi:MAG: peptidylprolyl isomerase [Burkholderiales bacterium]